MLLTRKTLLPEVDYPEVDDRNKIFGKKKMVRTDERKKKLKKWTHHGKIKQVSDYRYSRNLKKK